MLLLSTMGTLIAAYVLFFVAAANVYTFESWTRVRIAMMVVAGILLLVSAILFAALISAQ